MSRRRIQVLDTTLRDGEQSPGIALQPHEKAEIALQLERLGVDVIEAGFAGASPGDFEGVRAVARAVDEADRRLARPGRGRRPRRRRRGARRRRPLPHPHRPRDERAAHGKEARPRTTGGRGARPPVGRLRSLARRRGRVLVRGRDPLRPGVRRAGLPGRDRGRRDDRQPARHGRLFAAGGVRRLPRRRSPPLPGAPRRDPLRALPQRPRSRRRELARRDPGRRQPGRVHRERHRRAGGQRFARGGRDGAERSQRQLRGRDGDQHDGAHRRLEARVASSPATSSSRTRPSSARTRSRTRRASTRTAC